MFPVSAAMLKNPALYDQSLEAFSNPLMRLVEYELDDLGRMTVPDETGRLYRYIDMTAQAEALYDFVELTIEHELVEELDFLVNYDRTRQAIQEIVDMPDRLIDLFIRLSLQNNGRLSERKRESHFAFLTDDELADMETPSGKDTQGAEQIEPQLSIASRTLAASSFLEKGFWRNDTPSLSTPWLAMILAV
jgi:hypothetical protein